MNSPECQACSLTIGWWMLKQPNASLLAGLWRRAEQPLLRHFRWGALDYAVIRQTVWSCSAQVEACSAR
jgi:hypothetical protein